MQRLGDLGCDMKRAGAEVRADDAFLCGCEER